MTQKYDLVKLINVCNFEKSENLFLNNLLINTNKRLFYGDH